MGRYVLDDQSWTIERDGARLTITDVDGATRVEELADAKAATTRFTVLTNQKLRAGWKLWQPPAEPREAKPLPEAPIVFDAREPSLEAAILADPEAIEPYLVYADWLQTKGDPRGELIARHAALHADPNNPKLKQMVQARISRFADYFSGGFYAENTNYGYDWGFIQHASFDVDDEVGSIVEFLPRLLTVPSARFLLCLHLRDDGNRRELERALPIVAERVPATLRRLRLRGTAWLGDLDALETRLPALRRLGLMTAMGARCLELLARVPLPRLEALEVACNGGDEPLLVPMLVRRDLPALVELTLVARMTEDLCNALAVAPIAQQLELLELRGLDVGGTRRLLAILDAFPKLNRIGVYERRIDPAMYADLAARVRVYDIDEDSDDD